MRKCISRRDAKPPRTVPEIPGTRVAAVDARRIAAWFPNAKGHVGLVITSPPYLDTTNYREDQWLQLWFLGGPEVPRRKGPQRRSPSFWWASLGVPDGGVVGHRVAAPGWRACCRPPRRPAARRRPGGGGAARLTARGQWGNGAPAGAPVLDTDRRPTTTRRPALPGRRRRRATAPPPRAGSAWRRASCRCSAGW
jgi:hypothetical protein